MTYVDLFFGARGRFSRSRYWVGLAMCLFLYVAANTEFAFLAVAGPRQGFHALSWLGAPLAYVLWAYIVYLVATTHMRRCRDLGLSGVFGLIALATIVGISVALVIGGFKRGTIGANAYGPDPLVDLAEVVERFGAPRR